MLNVRRVSEIQWCCGSSRVFFQLEQLARTLLRRLPAPCSAVTSAVGGLTREEGYILFLSNASKRDLVTGMSCDNVSVSLNTSSWTTTI